MDGTRVSVLNEISQTQGEKKNTTFFSHVKNPDLNGYLLRCLHRKQKRKLWGGRREKTREENEGKETQNIEHFLSYTQPRFTYTTYTRTSGGSLGGGEQ